MLESEHLLEEVNAAAIAGCIEANPGFIKGFKLRLVGPVAQHQGEALVRRCKDISRQHNPWVGFPKRRSRRSWHSQSERGIKI